MKILLSFLQDNRDAPHAVPAYRFWAYYLKNGIEEAGMSWSEVPEADWAEGLVWAPGSPALEHWKGRIWQSTLDHIRRNRENIDIFLCYLYPKQIDVTAIREIQKMGIPCVNFYCDHIRDFNQIPAAFRIFDLMWVPEFEALPMYRNARVKMIHLPMPVWVPLRYRRISSVETPVVSFVGSKDLYREKLLQEVTSGGTALRISGSGWLEKGAASIPRNTVTGLLHNQFAFIKEKGLRAWFYKLDQLRHPLLSLPVDDQFIYPKPDFEEYFTLTQDSAVVLGINRVPTFKRPHRFPLTYSRLRDLEAPMLGACYLTEHCDGLTELYELDKEICTYRTADELAAKAKELLQSPAWRKELRINAQHQALSAHALPVSLYKLNDHLFKGRVS